MGDCQKSNNNHIAQKLPSNHLELPDGAAFASSAPKMDVLQMIVASEVYLPILNSRPDFEERKIREAFSVPFEL
jgi:hypothetical protein